MNTGGAFASAWIPAESDRMRKFRDTSGLLGTTISPSRNGQSKLFFSPAVCTTSAVRLGLGFRQHLWRHGGHTPQKSHEFSDARPPENVYSPPPPCMYTIGGCPPEPRPAPVQSSVHAEHDHLVFSKTVYYPVYNRPLQPYMTNLSAPWVLRPIPRTRPAPGKCIQPPPLAYNTCLPARAPANPVFMQSNAEHIRARPSGIQQDHPLQSNSSLCCVHDQHISTRGLPSQIHRASGKCIQHPPFCVQ